MPAGVHAPPPDIFDDKACDGYLARGIDKRLRADVGTLGAVVGFLPIGSLALRMAMIISRSFVGKLVEGFYAKVVGLQFRAAESSDPGVDFGQMGDIAAAY